MHVVQIHQATQLAELEQAWNKLASGIPFRTWDWLEAWWRHYGLNGPNDSACELLVPCVERGGHIVAIAPWLVQHSPWSGRTVRFLGTGEVCSDYLSLLAEPAERTAAIGTLADWLTNDVADLWDLIELNDVDAGDPLIAELTSAMSIRGCTADTRPGATCWRVALPNSWDGYLGQLSRSHRKQVRRMERRLFETGRARLRTVHTHDELEQGLAILIHLHQERQNSLGRVGCFSSPQFLSFHREVMVRLLNRGQLRLHWLELDNRPVAVEYHLAGTAGVFVYQGGMDPSALEESPGQLITVATIKLAIEQGYRCFDFLRGDEPYKAHWCAQPFPTVRLRIVPNRLATRLRHSIWAAAKGLQTLVRGTPVPLPIAASSETSS